MKKRIIASVLIVALMATCLLAFAACDKDEVPAEFEMPVGDRPDKASLISAEDQAIIDKGLAESAKDDDDESKDQDAIKAAVMALYNTANRSRIETPISLVVQATQESAWVRCLCTQSTSATARNGTINLQPKFNRAAP